MNFGLGLVLSFTDNATAGINSAVSSLNQLTSTAESASSRLNEIASLSAFSTIATQVGNAMTNAGSSIISTFSSAIGKINETGQTLSYAETAFDTLYANSDKTGAQVLKDIQKYAESSIFAFEDLIPVVKMLKANGIEAFDEITSSTGKSRQMLMDYASDLAAFNPQMRNAYGTGVQAAMGALNEYIAEGNKRSLKAGASIDITQILGEDVGSSIEERSQQVADLIEKLGMVGMTASMAGTPMQILSNMGDVLFNTLGKIANLGVYDEFTKIVSKLGEFVFGLEESGKLDKIAETIASAFVTLMKPVEKLVDWLIKLGNAFADLLANNPAIAKMVTVGTALAGVFLLIGGVAMKLMGTLGYLTLMIKQLGGSLSAIGTVMKTGATKILGALLPLTLALGLMYIVWKNDLFGIRTSVTQFVQNVVNSFQKAKTAVSGSLSDIQGVLKQYDASHSFFDGLTLALTKVMVLFKALAEGWNDYTLSEDTFNKAKELGILPLIEAIFDLKYRFDLFKAGFVQGWRDISTKVQAVIQGLASKVDGTIFEGLFDSITQFFQALSNNDADAWYQFGYSFAEFTAKAIAFTVALKAIGKAFSIISGVVKVIGGVIKGVSKIVTFVMGVPAKISAVWTAVSGAVAHVASDITGFIALVKEFGLSATMEGLFGTATTIASGIVSVVAGVALAFTNFFSMLKNGFSWLKEILMVVGVALATIGVIILAPIEGIGIAIAAAVGAIVALVMTAIVLIKEHWEQIKSFFSGLASWINQNVLQPILNFFSPVIELIKGMWDSFAQTVQHVVERIKGFIGELIAGVQSIWNNIMSYITPAIETFKELASTFGEFCSFIGGKLSDLWTGTIQPVLSAIGSFFQSVFSAIFNVVQTIWNAIWNVISPIVMGIWNTIQSVFTSIFDTIMNVLSNIWQGIVGVFNGIVTFIGSILNGIWQTISNVLMGIMNTIMGKNDEAKQNFSNALNAIKGIFTGAWNGLKQIVTSAMTAISSVISSIWNGIKNTFSSALNGIKSTVSSVFNAIKSTISSVLNGAVSIVQGAVSKFKSAFNFSWKLPDLKLPHVSVSGGSAPFGIAGKGSLPKFSVSWYKEGGVFDKPSVIGVGEAGQEAVMPLENNVEWIGTLAKMITSQMGSNMRPTSSQMVSNDNSSSETQYMTTNKGNTDNSQTDNSVVFQSGAIQITAQNSSAEEAEKLAQKIMEYIKRQQQLEKMLAYN